MKIEQLLQVIEVSETRSITKAAENLFMSQPSLSASLKSLEDEVGSAIFVRSNNGTQITPFGEKFLFHARAAVQQFHYIQNLASDQSLPLHFCAASYYFLFIDLIFAGLCQQSDGQDVTFFIRDDSNSAIVDSVATQECEIGIVSFPSYAKAMWMPVFASRDLEYHPLTQEMPHLLFDKNNPRYQPFSRQISPNQLAGATLVAYWEENQAIRQFYESQFALFSPRKLIYVSDRGSLVSLLAHTGGLHLATKNAKAYAKHSFYSELQAVPLKEVDFKMEIGWIKKKNNYVSDLGRSFLLLLQEALILKKPPFDVTG